MGLSIISFTENGMHLSIEILEKLEKEEVAIYTKCSRAKETEILSFVQFVEQTIDNWTREQMERKNSLLFIGACGIAVRAIAPYIADKLQDSPVLVMDERGKYIIPILSGHVGGANEIAMQIASKIGAIPVITTATDINEKFAVDLFAKRNNLHIVNREGIAKVSSKVLAGKKITISIETGHFEKGSSFPKEIQIVSYPPKQSVDVVITTEERKLDTLLFLKPKEYAIGMGCKKGKEIEKIEALIQKSLQKNSISKNQVFALASKDCKKEEEGLLTLSKKENIPFLTFTAKQLQKAKGTFQSSDFVKEQVGVDNVCERAAFMACKGFGKLIYQKHAEDGITIAIAKREWRVTFDEE